MWDTLKLEVVGIFSLQDKGFFFKEYQSAPTFRKRFFNPDPKTIAKYGFLPKLTVYENLHRGKWGVVRFEVVGSLPKMVYGTSYYGLDEQDNDLVIETLVKKLAILGIECTAQDIERANAQIIAYCFNFYLPPELARPKELILPLSHLDVGKRAGNIIEQLWLQVKPGYGVKFHNKQRGIGFYDKVAEIENNSVQTDEDKRVLDLVKSGGLPYCMKIENTLQNRTAVKKGLATVTDKDDKKERHIREVLQNRVSLAFLKNVFDRLADGRDVKALEQQVFPLEEFYEQCKRAGLGFQEGQLLFAHAVAVQQIGSLRIKQIADSFPKYGRQYRQRYYDKLNPITEKVEGRELSAFLGYCQNQLQSPIVKKPAAVQDGSV